MSRRVALVVLAVLAVLSASACTAAGERDALGEKATAPTKPVAATRATAKDAAPATTPPPPAPPPAPAPPPVYRLGAEGPEVAAIQQRLADLKFDVPAVDGHYGEATRDAVMAFQKVHGLGRDGFAGPETMGALTTVTGDPAPLVTGEPDRVEVDLARQVLFLYHGGALVRIVAVSTGNGEHYCTEGRCRNAVTPTGEYRVGRRASGWETSPLGELYNPLYFNGGIAFHGSRSVPAFPASHGCVRLPMHTAEWFPGAVPEGMLVVVV